MKRETEIKELLISNAIHLIATGGFEKATTKELAHNGGDLPDFRMNDVYVYRIFGSKENVYEAAFDRLDRELSGCCREAYIMAMKTEPTLGHSIKQKVFNFFETVWEFILGNEERCRCYVRYYYSVYFKGRSYDEHKRLFAGLISDMAGIFKEEADVFAILHSVFISMLDFAIRVYNGEVQNNDEDRPHIFNVLFCMMSTYFKDAPSGIGVNQ